MLGEVSKPLWDWPPLRHEAMTAEVCVRVCMCTCERDTAREKNMGGGGNEKVGDKGGGGKIGK